MLKKQEIREVIESINLFDFENMDLPAVTELFQNLKNEKYTRTFIESYVERENGEYAATITIFGYRSETEEEFQSRVNRIAIQDLNQHLKNKKNKY